MSLKAAASLFATLLMLQQAPAPPAPDTAPAAEAIAALKPLPDIKQLMLEVEAHQRTEEAVQKTYIFHEQLTTQQNKSDGSSKRLLHEEYDCFFLEGVFVRKLVRKDGRDLTPEEQKKEDKRIDDEVAKGKARHEKADEKGKQTDSAGHDEITVSRILELGTFSNAHREQIDGRDTIVVDYAGDPNARTRNRAEAGLKDLVGTVYVDEQEKVIAGTRGRFLKDFKIAGGLVFDLKKNTSFEFQQKRVAPNVWLPLHIHADGSLHALLVFSFNGSFDATYNNYRRFKTGATMLDGVGRVDANGNPMDQPADQPKPSSPEQPNVPPQD